MFFTCACFEKLLIYFLIDHFLIDDFLNIAYKYSDNCYDNRSNTITLISIKKKNILTYAYTEYLLIVDC